MNTISRCRPRRGKAARSPIACINKATVDLGVPFDKLTATLQKCLRTCIFPSDLGAIR